MCRLRTSFSLLAVAALAWPASAERFTLAQPMPFTLEGISGVVLPVTAEQAAETPICIELSPCSRPFAESDQILFRVALEPGSAPLHAIGFATNLPTGLQRQAGYLPTDDPTVQLPTNPASLTFDSNKAFKFAAPDTLDAGESSPGLVTAHHPLGPIRTWVNSGNLASVRVMATSVSISQAVGSVALVSLEPAPAVSLQRIHESYTDFERPVAVTAPPGDDRLFVAEQMSVSNDGTRFARIYVRPADATPATYSSIFLTVEVAFDHLDPGEERGLLGLAFAPDYATSGVFYVHYVAPDPDVPSAPGRITVARYTVSGDPNIANPVGTVLLSIPKPGPPAFDLAAFESYHNGGSLAFGPDGALYVGVGDGAGYHGYDAWNCAQNPASPLGKILRLDPAVLAASPVIVAASAQCPTLALPAPAGLEFWASGLRNPWRFSFDRELGDLWIGDVGEVMREEIDFVAAEDLSGAGPNFGWDVEEGSACNPTNPAPSPACGSPGLTPPVYDYAHVANPFGCTGSVIGGFVHRGPVVALRGKYLLGDPCQGFLRTLTPDGVGGLLVEDLPPELMPQIGFLSSFGEDGRGRIYAVDYANGDVYRLVPETGAWASGLAALGALSAAARRRRQAARR